MHDTASLSTDTCLDRSQRVQRAVQGLLREGERMELRCQGGRVTAYVHLGGPLSVFDPRLEGAFAAANERVKHANQANWPLPFVAFSLCALGLVGGFFEFALAGSPLAARILPRLSSPLGLACLFLLSFFAAAWIEWRLMARAFRAIEPELQRSFQTSGLSWTQVATSDARERYPQLWPLLCQSLGCQAGLIPKSPGVSP